MWTEESIKHQQFLFCEPKVKGRLLFFLALLKSRVKKLGQKCTCATFSLLNLMKSNKSAPIRGLFMCICHLIRVLIYMLPVFVMGSNQSSNYPIRSRNSFWKGVCWRWSRGVGPFLLIGVRLFAFTTPLNEGREGKRGDGGVNRRSHHERQETKRVEGKTRCMSGWKRRSHQMMQEIRKQDERGSRSQRQCLILKTPLLMLVK